MRELIEQEVIDVVQPDTGRAGGILQMQKIAHLAEAHHVMVAPHSVSKRANAHTSQHVFVSCPVLSCPFLCFALLSVVPQRVHYLIIHRRVTHWTARCNVWHHHL